MSYCVNCGVELDGGARACPLCQTPVINPASPVDTTLPPNFPVERREVEPVNRRELSLVLTVMLGCAGISCILLNLLFLWRGVPWSAIVAGSFAMIWVWSVPPLLCRRIGSLAWVGLDLLAVAGLLWLIAFVVHGEYWLVHLALPIWFGTSVIVLFLWYTFPRRSILSRCTVTLGSCAVFLIWLELCIDVFFGGYFPMWSVVAAAVCITLLLPLVVVRFRPHLREEVRRRFHF